MQAFVRLAFVCIANVPDLMLRHYTNFQMSSISKLLVIKSDKYWNANKAKYQLRLLFFNFEATFIIVEF